MTDKFNPLPAVDVSQHLEVVKSAATLFAKSVRVIRLPEEYDDSYLRDTSFVKSWVDDYDAEYVRVAPFVDMGYVQPMRFIAGMDQTEADVDPEFLRVDWREPVTLTLEAREVDIELIKMLFGSDPRLPLCEQQIPAKGQE